MSAIKRVRQVLCVFALGFPFSTSGQQPLEKPSNDEIAKQLANPNTPLATMRLKYLYTFYKGDLPGAGSQSNYSMLFQPSFPFPLANGDSVFWLPALPIIFEQPIWDIGREEFVDRTGLDYYVEQADAFGPEWIIGFNVAPVVENVLEGLMANR